MPSRPASSADRATFMPSPSSPIRWSTGTRAPSKSTCVVTSQARPIFFSGRRSDMPGVSAGHDERAEPPGRVLAGAGEEDVVVGAGAVADPLLGAVDDVARRRRARARVLMRADVGAGLRFGQAVGAEPVAAQHPRQPGRALLVGGVGRDDRRGQRVHARSRPPRSARPRRSPRRPGGTPRTAGRRRRTPRRTAGSSAPTCPSRAYAAAGNSPFSSASATCGASSLVASSRVSSSSASASSVGSSRSTVVGMPRS